MLANFMAWMDKRLPLTDAWNKHLVLFWLTSHASTCKPNFNRCMVNYEL